MATSDPHPGRGRDADGFREDAAELERECGAFVHSVVEAADADGVVVAMSGGIDSTTAATLAAEALGPGSVYGLILPAAPNDTSNLYDAQRAAFDLGIQFRTVDVQPVVDALTDAMDQEYWLQQAAAVVAAGADADVTLCDPIGLADGYDEAVGNATARTRMMATYFEANLRDRLVLGTGNRSELLLGYFTKYGDGGVDLLPLGGLYKTEVRRLATHLGVPTEIVEKEPTAGLWEGQTDAEELGASYETIDAVLRKLVDEDCGVERTAAELDVDRDLVGRFDSMRRRAEHKSRLPPTPATYVA